MRDEESGERIDLRVRTKQFALRIIRLYSALPKRTEAEVIGKQALRSGTSVGANFREAHRSRSDAEFVSKLGDCLKELEETIYWLELLVEGKIVPAGLLTPLQDECNQLIAILTTIAKKVKSQAK
ncbi:four helix bundle protein [Zavarzinella formosa]|uniref:four helix bundle protein n=1 Tax=Zavarzinella formosa TaxID=360055 RepID=UPI000496F345|nr:four helix bundle protein [Zavarzinella formosa]